MLVLEIKPCMCLVQVLETADSSLYQCLTSTPLVDNAGKSSAKPDSSASAVMKVRHCCRRLYLCLFSSALGFFPIEAIMGNGELGFDSGEGA
jgi:hypothetical protein